VTTKVSMPGTMYRIGKGLEHLRSRIVYRLSPSSKLCEHVLLMLVVLRTRASMCSTLQRGDPVQNVEIA